MTTEAMLTEVSSHGVQVKVDEGRPLGPYSCRMGMFYQNIEVEHIQRLHRAQVPGLVDTGASFTILLRSVLEALGVSAVRKVSLELADGAVIEREIGEVRLAGEGAVTYECFGDEAARPVLGAHAVGGLLLAVDPSRKRLVPTHGAMM